MDPPRPPALHSSLSWRDHGRPGRASPESDPGRRSCLPTLSHRAAGNRGLPVATQSRSCLGGSGGGAGNHDRPCPRRRGSARSRRVSGGETTVRSAPHARTSEGTAPQCPLAPSVRRLASGCRGRSTGGPRGRDGKQAASEGRPLYSGGGGKAGPDLEVFIALTPYVVGATACVLRSCCIPRIDRQSNPEFAALTPEHMFGTLPVLDFGLSGGRKCQSGPRFKWRVERDPHDLTPGGHWRPATRSRQATLRRTIQ